LRTQQATLTTNIAADYSKYGQDNPKLSDDRAVLTSINQQIEAEVARIGERAANDYKASQVVEDNMRAVYEKERNSADNLNNKAIELLIAREEAGNARSLYQMLFSHLKEAGVIEGLHSSNISVIDAGRIPSKPVPDVPIYLALSLVCGCIFGAAGAVFAEAMDDRVEGMASIEKALKARILAVLPLIQPTNVRRRLLSDNQDSDAGSLGLLDSPNTSYVEALRGLRTSLLFSHGSKPPKTILVTSAVEKEGKSIVSLNLAAVLALNGSRVLLVDADLRSAGLSGYLGVEREANGLSEALSLSIDPPILTPFPNLPRLSVIPAGPTPKYPAELLGSEHMSALVREWNESYDYVLVDSPPVLAVTDALLLGRLTDTTLLVARHGQSTQRSLERAYQMVQDVEGRKADIVLNGVNRNSTSFDEFYGYTGTKYYSEA
jgi:polysaccharide biosynthesis transport protein